MSDIWYLPLVHQKFFLFIFCVSDENISSMSKCLAMFTIGNNRSMECLDFMINEKWEKVFVIAIGHSLVCCWPQAWPEFKGNNVCKVSLENWINKKDFKWNFAQIILI